MGAVLPYYGVQPSCAVPALLPKARNRCSPWRACCLASPCAAQCHRGSHEEPCDQLHASTNSHARTCRTFEREPCLAGTWQAALVTPTLPNALRSQGHGQPLDSVSRHDAQFYRVDPLMAALTRSMGAQAVRPRSLELRDELHRATEDFEQAVRAEVRKVVAAAGAGSAGRLRGQGRGEGPAGGTGREAEVHGVVGELVARRLPGLSYKYEDVQRLRGQYNGAVLADKETYGSVWPLEPVRRLEFGQEVEQVAREELGIAGSS